MKQHKFYHEVYVKNGGKSFYNLHSYSGNNELKTVGHVSEIIEKESVLLMEANIITKNESDTLKNMILHTKDEDNILIGMLLLKKHRKILDKKLKDPIFESEFIINIACDYYNKIHRPYMDNLINKSKK